MWILINGLMNNDKYHYRKDIISFIHPTVGKIEKFQHVLHTEVLFIHIFYNTLFHSHVGGTCSSYMFLIIIPALAVWQCRKGSAEGWGNLTSNSEDLEVIVKSCRSPCYCGPPSGTNYCGSLPPVSC